MEENNKLETNTDSSGSGSTPDGAVPQPQESAVSRPVQLTKPSDPEMHGTPSVQMANPMGFGPIQAPPPIQGAQPAKPKKSKTGLIVGILCAAAVVIVIGIGALAAKSLLGGGDPRTQLAKGMTNMAKEMAAYQSSVVEDIGLAEFNKLKDAKPIHTNIDVSFTDPSLSGGIDNIDIELDGVTDWKNKMAEYDLSVGTYGINMNIGSLVAADNTLYVSVPIVFQNEVYSLDLTNLGRDFNNSAWSSLMDETLPEDYSLTLFSDTKVEDGGASEFAKIFERRSGSLAESVKFEAIKQKREFTFDGTFAEYGGVQVTIDKDAYNEAIEAIKNDVLASDYYTDIMKGYQTTYSGDFDEFKETTDNVIEQIFGIRYEQDVVINFYLDKKGRIVNMSTPEDIAISSQYSDVDSIAVDIDFSGRERALDSIEGGIYVQSGDEILHLGISRKANITEDFYSEDLTLRLQDNNSSDDLTFWYANKWGYDDHTFDIQMSLEAPDTSLGLRADGAFTNIVKGERYTFRINHGAVSADGEDLLLMTGSIETEPSDNTIEVPRNATDILEMSAGDIMSLFYGMLY